MTREENAAVAAKTIGEARSKFYHVFGDAPGADKYEDSLKYVEHIGLITETDITNWPLEAFMEGGLPVSSKKELNKRFFALREKVTPTENAPALEPVIGISKLGLTALGSQAQLSLAKLMVSLPKRAENLRAEIASYEEEKEKARKRLEVAEASLEKAKKGHAGLDLLKDLEEALKDGFYSCPPQDRTDCFSLITRDVQLSYFNTKQAVKMFVPMGQYEVQVIFGPAHPYLKVWPYDKTPIAGESCHPHVSVEGNLCFGNLTDQYLDDSKMHRIPEMLEAAKKVLNCYNTGDAYVGLERYLESWQGGSIVKNGWHPFEAEWSKDGPRRSLRGAGEDSARPRRDGRIRGGLRGQEFARLVRHQIEGLGYQVAPGRTSPIDNLLCTIRQYEEYQGALPGNTIPELERLVADVRGNLQNLYGQRAEIVGEINQWPRPRGGAGAAGVGGSGSAGPALANATSDGVDPRSWYSLGAPLMSDPLIPTTGPAVSYTFTIGPEPGAEE